MKTILSKFRASRTGVAAAVALAAAPITVYAISDYFLEIYYSGTIGSNSYNSTAQGVLMVGYGNAAATYNVNRALAVGEYNLIYDSGSTVLGKYNKDTGGDELLVLGRGTSATKRNAIAVFKDGKIAIQPQGDISMGIYGHPGDTGMGIYAD
jgi:hypothetical protein